MFTFASNLPNNLLIHLMEATAALRSGAPMHQAVKTLADNLDAYRKHPLLEEAARQLVSLVEGHSEQGERIASEVRPEQALRTIYDVVSSLDGLSGWTKRFYDCDRHEALREQLMADLGIPMGEAEEVSCREERINRVDEFFILKSGRGFIESFSEPAGIFRVGDKVDLVMVNKKNVEVSGLSEEHVKSIDFTDNIHPDDKSRFLEEMVPIIVGRSGSIKGFRLKIHDGSYIWVDLWAGMIADMNLGVYFLINQTEKYEALEERKVHQWLKSEIDGMERIREDDLPVITKELKRISSRLSVLNALRRGRPEMREFQVNDVLEENKIRAGLPSDMELNLHLNEAPSYKVRADIFLLEEVIKELVSNASAAMAGVSEDPITVETDEISLSEGDIGNLPFAVNKDNAKPGDYVRISVSDVGPGIARDHIDRIFRASGEGEEGGLFIAQVVMAKFGGFITVRSDINRGSTFSLYLPAV